MPRLLKNSNWEVGSRISKSFEPELSKLLMCCNEHVFLGAEFFTIELVYAAWSTIQGGGYHYSVRITITRTEIHKEQEIVLIADCGSF